MNVYQHSFVLCLLITICLSSDWDYDSDGEDWVEHWEECGGSHQSPINIITGDTECEEPLTLDWTSESEYFVVGNNGHSLQAVAFKLAEEKGSHLTNIDILNHRNDTSHRLQNLMYNTYTDAINEEYCLDSIHFHWGETDDYGSEHALNGQLYPLEAHFVHFSCDYYESSDAQNAYSTNSIAQYDDDNILGVISVLFEIGDEGNDVLSQILNDEIIDGIFEYHDIVETLSHHEIQLFYTEFDLMDMLPENKEVIAYKGSLTTPPCYETVRWHVMKNTMTVSHDQMEQFRALLESTHENHTIAPNYRPLQDETDRIMYECVETLVAVDKTEITETDDGEDDVDESKVSLEDELEMWRVISIVFICLFGVALVAVMVLAGYVYSGSNTKEVTVDNKKYQMARRSEVQSDECDDIEMTKKK